MTSRSAFGRSPVSTVLVALVIALALVTAACSSDDQPTSSGSGPDLVGTSEAASDGVRLRVVATVAQPVALAPRPGTSDLYVAEQGGVVRRIAVSGEGPDRSYDVDDAATLDISDLTKAVGEQGLLGLAFSPEGDRLYVDYTDRAGDTHVVEYPMDGNRADAEGAREILFVEQPYPNHNGGQLAFGPDGYLYLALGDGGSRDDPERRAQNPDELLGKILRIDPLGGEGEGLPYAIPSGNPFAEGGGRPEIWITGARNPWRFSFDQQTDDLWVADVGQNEIEEINFLPAPTGRPGEVTNLGWPYYEGTNPHLDTPPPGAAFIEPVWTYPHTDGACSITGGYVYRGAAIAPLVGTYLYGDYCTSEIEALEEAGDGSWTSRSLGVAVAPNSLSSFGQDLDGEIYVLSTEGSVYRLDPA